MQVLIEELCQGTAWANRILGGIRSAARKKRIELELRRTVEEVDAGGRVVILVCASLKWATEAIAALNERGVHPLLYGFQYVDTMHRYSCITFTYTKSSYLLAKYLLSREHAPVALLGYNDDSMPDLLRLRGVRYAAEEAGVPYTVFGNAGNALACIDGFAARAGEFGSVVCCNDVVALLFASRYPALAARTRMASCSGSMLGKFSKFRYPTMRTDEYAAGLRLLELALFLGRQKEIGSTFMTLEADLVLPEGEEDVPADAPRLSVRTVDFYGDPAVRAVEGLNRMLLRCDEIDFSILRAIGAGLPYEEIAERENLAVNTVKYRVRAMLGNAELGSRRELTEAIARFGLDFSE